MITETFFGEAIGDVEHTQIQCIPSDACATHGRCLIHSSDIDIVCECGFITERRMSLERPFGVSVDRIRISNACPIHKDGRYRCWCRPWGGGPIRTVLPYCPWHSCHHDQPRDRYGN